MSTLYETLEFIKNNYDLVIAGIGLVAGLSVGYALHLSSKKIEKLEEELRSSGLEERIFK